jgi:cation transport ATPase
MLAEKIRVEASSVATTARWSVVVVVVCGGLGFVVGAERAIRADRMTEGVMLVIASAMATAVSLTVLLFIVWRTGPTSPPGTTAGSTARPFD